MEEILRSHEQDIQKLAEEGGMLDDVISGVGNELFSDKITITRIAFFLAFAQKIIDLYPCRSESIYKEVFKNLYKNIKF